MTPHPCRRLGTHRSQPHHRWPSAWTALQVIPFDYNANTRHLYFGRFKDDGAPSPL